MNNAKQLTLDWILKNNRTPYPYSPQKAALKNLDPKQPVYFDGNYLKGLTWKNYQYWESLDDNFKSELIKVWHNDERIEGIGCNAGWNGEFYFSMIDFDLKNFESLEVMEQAVTGWENRNPGMSLCPRVKTQSGGYRYFVGFESVPKDWKHSINFTFTQGGEKLLGELMTGPGGLGIILGKGLKGDYLWDRNACGDIPVFPTPESIGLYQVEKAIAPSVPVASIYDNPDTPEQAREALSFIPVNHFDGDYQGWINIGMACHSGGLDFEDWDNWSQGSKSYSNSKDTFNHWKSFKDGGGITAATLFKFAKDNGYKPPRKQQQQTKLINTSHPSTVDNRNSTASIPVTKKTTPQEIKNALRECEKILLDVTIDDIDKLIKVEEIKQELKVSNTLWQGLLSQINRIVCEKRLNLELKALLQSEDKIKREIELSRIAQTYRLNIHSLQKMLKEMEVRISMPEYESMDFEQLFNMGSKAVDFLIPGLLPKGESALVVAMPKTGKSLLSVDAAFAVATGEDSFLGETCVQGRVLYVSVDESRESVTRKMIKRGFRASDKDSIRIVTTFSINQLPKLEAEIEAFKPVLVVIDSLKRITKGLETSENSAEFSDNVYTISEMCNRYGAACLLIHHSNKNTESIGVENVRGSTAIAGACGNTWILNRVGKEDPNNKKKIIYDPRDPKRHLYCFSRDSEGKSFSIELNPENNSWQLLGEMGIGEEEAEQMKTAKTRILKVFELNQKHHPEGLSGSTIFDCLDGQSPGEITKGSMYTTLHRLISDKIIGSKPAPGDKRYTLYFLPGYGQDEPPETSKQTQQPKYTTDTPTDSSVEDLKKSTIPPLPPLCDPDAMQYAQTYTEYGKKIDNIYPKLDNNYITPLDEKTPVLCTSNPCVEIDTAYCITNNNDKGGGGSNDQNGEEPNHTTTATDVTTFSDRTPEPTPTDFDGLDVGGVLITEFKELHLITARKGQQWLTHRGEYVSRTALQNQDFKVPTIGEMVTAIGKAYVTQDSELAHLLTKTFKNDPFSLFCQAIATDKNLELIYTL
jgi:KaiC/GvpD/RAD55 family RecA-like ATPase